MPRPRNPRPPRPAPLRPAIRAQPLGAGLHAYEVVFRMMLHGQQLINLLHFRDSAGGAFPTAEQDINTRVSTGILSAYQGTTSNELQFISCSTRRLDVPTSQPITFVFPGNPVGSLVGPALPSYSAAVLTLRTLVRSACARGRLYIPGVRQADELASSLIPAAVTSFQTLATVLANTFAGGGSGQTFTPIVLSRKWSNLITGVVSCTDISSASSNAALGTSRRRKLGRGR